MPYPLNYGTRIKIYQLLKYLAPRCNLTLLALCHSIEDIHNAKYLRKLNIEVITVLIPNKKSLLHRLFFKVVNFTLSIFFLIPQDLLYTNCYPFRKKIKELAILRKFHIVHFEYWWTGYLMKYFKNIKNFVLEEDVEFVRYQRAYNLKNFGLSKFFSYLLWKSTFKYEIKCCSYFNTILTVTPKDKEVLEKFLDKEIIFSPFLLDIDLKMGELSPSNSSNLIFVGGKSPHNIDAILYLIKDIFPKIREEVSEANLYIIGGELGKEIISFNGRGGIFVPGYVKEVKPYFEKCSIMVAPLRFGSGIKGKIIEAMMYKRAVVTTSIGAEGIGLTNGKDVIIADSKEEFIRETVNLLRDKEKRERLIENAFKLMQENYSKEKAYQRFYQIYGI
jgi:glycosyltransferase involved in cell wall biosynthesis